MVRIINKHNRGYYIDNDGLVFPLSRNYTSHVLIINGNFTEPFEIAPNVKLSDWATSDESKKAPMIYKLFELAKFITDDPFWNSQITQVYVDGPNDIELIPRVGSHIVQLGSPEDIKPKFEKLKLFYERALPAEGWNKYKLINLKYKNQIVCTKR
jgi:cell division protein FtsQ